MRIFSYWNKKAIENRFRICFIVTMLAGIFLVWSLAPQLVVAAPVAVGMSGGGSHSLALRSDGTVWAWGWNEQGQLGIGTTTGHLAPVKVSGLTGVISIAAGGAHSLALRNDGTVWAWGWNARGQLGDGTNANRRTPVRVSGITDIVAVATGYQHSLALRNDGTVWAWGDNPTGQLGDGTTTIRLEPVQVSGLTNTTNISAGWHHSLAVRSDNTVQAWGANSNGQLGDGTTTQRNTPVEVSGLTNVSTIAAGKGHSLALRNDGTVWAWGDNPTGQLGDGTTTIRLEPVQVSGLTNTTNISAGWHHSLALRSDGTAWAWGWNGNGQLGDGTNTNRRTPIRASGLANVIALTAGGIHSLSLTNNSNTWAWGFNPAGQLGDGTTTQRFTPVQTKPLFAPATGITVTPITVAIFFDDSHQLISAVAPSDALQAVTWTSSNTAVVTVNASGLVTGVAAGTATITAATTDGTNRTASSTVTIGTRLPASSITIAPTTATVHVYTTRQFTSTVTPLGALQAVAWSSNNPAVATVNAKGLVTGVAPGTATITAATIDGTNRTATSAIAVAVRPSATEITVTPATANINIGDTYQLTSAVTPSDALQDVAWSSSDPAVATVNAKGLVAGVAPGTATITAATVDGTNRTATSAIAVAVRPSATEITVTPATANINIGDTYQLTSAVTPSDALQDVAWSSSDPAVAIVNTSGLVTGVAAGTATITAATTDGTSLTALSTITMVESPAPPLIVEQPIVAGQTTEVELENVMKVTVTAGAVTGEAPKITAQVMPKSEATLLIAAATRAGLTVVGEVVVLTMSGGEFTAPVQLTLNFNETGVGPGQKPCVFVYNERTRRWIFLGGQVGDSIVSISLDRFSKFAVFATMPLPELADIADHWSRGSIRTLAGMGIVSGLPNGNFNPNAAVTRAEFVSMLTRALGLVAKPEAAARFTDAAGWAQGAIGAASEAGLIAGYADGTFGGSRRITRAEIAVILQRLVRKGLVPVLWAAGTNFADANVFPAWAADGIRMASAAGLVRGFQDRSFRPGGNTTRAEAAAMLYRLVAMR